MVNDAVSELKAGNRHDRSTSFCMYITLVQKLMFTFAAVKLIKSF